MAFFQIPEVDSWKHVLQIDEGMQWPDVGVPIDGHLKDHLQPWKTVAPASVLMLSTWTMDNNIVLKGKT